MKKVFLFMIATLLFAFNGNAQEVHGVESKMVCTYDCNPDGSWDNWGRYTSGIGYEHRPWFSYEFTNMNSISVSVEVELYHYECVEAFGFGICDKYDYVLKGTKSFVLGSKESYIWKNGKEKGIDCYNNDLYETDQHTDYYVVYKAYKLL